MSDQLPHMLNRYTWQAHAYGRIILDNYKTGHHSNGNPLNQKDKEEIIQLLKNSNEVLTHYGLQPFEIPITQNQLSLFN